MNEMFLILETDALDLEIAISRLDVYVESSYLFTEANEEQKSGTNKPGFFRSVFNKILKFFDDAMLAIRISTNQKVNANANKQQQVTSNEDRAKLMEEINSLNKDLNNGCDMYRKISGGEEVDPEQVKEWSASVNKKTSNKETIRVGSDILANHVLPILAAAKGKVHSLTDLKNVVKKHYVEDNHGRALEDLCLSSLSKISSRLCQLSRPL